MYFPSVEVQMTISLQEMCPPSEPEPVHALPRRQQGGVEVLYGPELFLRPLGAGSAKADREKEKEGMVVLKLNLLIKDSEWPQ